MYDETGKKGHQALRTLIGAGFKDVTNISGGHISLQRFARAMGFKNISIDLLPVDSKSIGNEISEVKEEKKEVSTAKENNNAPIVIDVRSVQEFRTGAFPGAVNIPLDELPRHINELGDKSRNITLYCASGARSAYGQRVLQQLGFTNVINGGGLMHMMQRQL